MKGYEFSRWKAGGRSTGQSAPGDVLVPLWPFSEGNDLMTQSVLQQGGLETARQDIDLAVSLSPETIRVIAQTYALPELT